MFFVDETKFDRCAGVVVGFAKQAFEVTFVAPVDEFEVGAVDDEPRWIVVGLDDVAELRVRVFEAGRWVFLDGKTCR